MFAIGLAGNTSIDQIQLFLTGLVDGAAHPIGLSEKLGLDSRIFR
jgi:hypothetical protein